MRLERLATTQLQPHELLAAVGEDAHYVRYGHAHDLFAALRTRTARASR